MEKSLHLRTVKGRMSLLLLLPSLLPPLLWLLNVAVDVHLNFLLVQILQVFLNYFLKKKQAQSCSAW